MQADAQRWKNCVFARGFEVLDGLETGMGKGCCRALSALRTGTNMKNKLVQ